MPKGKKNEDVFLDDVIQEEPNIDPENLPVIQQESPPPETPGQVAKIVLKHQAIVLYEHHAEEKPAGTIIEAPCERFIKLARQDLASNIYTIVYK